MTYKDLLQQLQQLREGQLNKDVCVWDSENQDEYYQVSVRFMSGDDYPIIRF